MNSTTSKAPSAEHQKEGRQNRTIKVVRAPPATPDIYALSQAEAGALIEAVARDMPDEEGRALRAVSDILATTRRLRRLGGFFAVRRQSNIDRDGQGDAASPPEITLRRLFHSSAVVPVVIQPGIAIRSRARAREEMRVRPGGRKRAVTPRGKELSLMPEERVVVVALELAGVDFGGIILDAYAGAETASLPHGAPLCCVLSPEALAVNGIGGAYPVFSVMLSRGQGGSICPPACLPTPRAGGAGRTTNMSPAALGALAGEISSAVDYHLSGAATFLAAEAAHKLADALLAPPAAVGKTAAAPAAAAEDMDAVLAALAAQLGELEGFGKAGDSPAMAYLADVVRANVPGVYLRLLSADGIGRGEWGPEEVARHLEPLRADLARANRTAALEKAVEAEIVRAGQYMRIIADKLGGERAASVREALGGQDAQGGGPASDVPSPGRILGELDKKERALVETVYADQLEERRASLANKCPHVPLARRLRQATSGRQAAEILRRLSAYFRREGPMVVAGRVVVRSRSRARVIGAQAPASARGDTVGDEWITCKNCGFRVICPHVEALIRMDGQGVPYAAVRDRLRGYAVSVPNRGPDMQTPFVYNYFCRICSEKLAEFVTEDRTPQRLGSVGGIDGYLRRLIWRAAADAARRHVRFPVPVDPRLFADTAVDVCHPLIERAEAALLQRGRILGEGDGKLNGAAEAEWGDGERADPRLQLYVALYVYAHILNLIRTASARRGGKLAKGAAGAHGPAADAPLQLREIGFENVRAGGAVSAYARAILKTVVKDQAYNISRIPDINKEFIRERFLEAYRSMVTDIGDQVLTMPPPVETTLYDLVVVDPVFSYALLAAQVLGPLPIPTKPGGASRVFKVVIGKSLEGFIATAPKQAELMWLMFGLQRGGRRGGMPARVFAAEIPEGMTPLYIHSDPRFNLYGRIFRADPKGPVGKSIEAFATIPATAPPKSGGRERKRKKGPPLDKTGEGGRGSPLPGARRPRKAAPAGVRGGPTLRRIAEALAAPRAGRFADAYGVFVEYTTEVVDHDGWTRYAVRLREHTERDARYADLRDAFALPNGSRAGAAPRVGDGHTFARDPRLPITYLYDENGRAHLWKIYVYSAAGGAGKGDAPRVELTPVEIMESLEAGDAPLVDMALVDTRCTVCGVLQSGISGLDSAKTRESLDAFSQFRAFYTFYEVRCPVGGVHDFGAMATECRKCGLPEALVRDYAEPSQAGVARAYYDRYSATYRAERAELEEAIAVGLEKGPGPPTTPSKGVGATADLSAEVGAWSPDHSAFTRAAALVKVEVPVIMAIGDTEGRTSSEIRAGEGVTEVTRPGDPRIYAADAAVRVFMVAYSMLRNVTRFARPPPAAEEILRAAGAPPDEWPKLPGHFPLVIAEGPGGKPGEKGVDLVSYFARFRAIQAGRRPAEARLYALETLCRAVLALAGPGTETASTPPKWLPRLRKLFAVQTLEGIIRSEGLLSLPEEKAAGASGDGDDPWGGEGPQFVFGDHGGNSEDILDAASRKDVDNNIDAPDDANPYSYEGMDYGGDNDEPQ